jgi:ABC-type transporter Mla MlaB component
MNDLVRLALTGDNRTRLANQITNVLRQEDLSARDVAMLCRALGELSRDAQATSEAAIKVERLIAGEPTEILRVDFTETTLEQADSTAAALIRAIEEARETERVMALKAVNDESDPAV